jgi:hypothetical protein
MMYERFDVLLRQRNGIIYRDGYATAGAGQTVDSEDLIAKF